MLSTHIYISVGNGKQTKIKTKQIRNYNTNHEDRMAHNTMVDELECRVDKTKEQKLS